MSVRKALPILLLSGALAFGGAACGDKTVTSTPSGAPAPANDSNGASADAPSGSSNDVTASADAELTQVDQLLRDIESDLSAVDQDAATPEGDPTR